MRLAGCILKEFTAKDGSRLIMTTCVASRHTLNWKGYQIKVYQVMILYLTAVLLIVGSISCDVKRLPIAIR